MAYLNSFDYMVIAVYFTILVGLGIYLKKKASASIEDYFIGGRRVPWWALGISGMASWLDIAGTMLIVSFLYILGPRGIFIEFRGGVCLILPFMMLWVGKWMRRSQCITPAEWMIFRFGDGFGGRFAQLASVTGAIITTVGMLGYLVKAVGLFLSTFLPFEPYTCALLLIGIATLYTMVSGFYGVVFTDIFQSGIILTAVITISILASVKVANCENFTALAAEVTGQANWVSIKPGFDTHMPVGYENYRNLFMFAFFYLLNNVFRGMGFPGDPKYFGARNDRECGTLSLLWVVLMMFRWPLMIGFAVLGVFLVKDIYPDQTVLLEAADTIKHYFPDVTRSGWPGVISNIMNHTDKYPNLAADLAAIFNSQNWAEKLNLLSYDGTVLAERILPAVLLNSVPVGLRGMMLVALVAASMSTFDSTVNATTGLMTRDIYQKYIRPGAGTKELIYVSWFFVLALVCLGFLFGMTLESVNDVWGWLVMGLGAGALVPGFLRLYWWRFNGGGFAIGTLTGIVAACLQRIVVSSELIHKYAWLQILNDERWLFCILLVVGFIGTIIGTYLTKPTNKNVLQNFYIKTKPFGVWGPLCKTLSSQDRTHMRREHFYDIVSVPAVMLWQVTLFITPMLFIVRNFKAAIITLCLFVAGAVGTYFLWYKNLPPATTSGHLESSMSKSQDGE